VSPSRPRGSGPPRVRHPLTARRACGGAPAAGLREHRRPSTGGGAPRIEDHTAASSAEASSSGRRPGRSGDRGPRKPLPLRAVAAAGRRGRGRVRGPSCRRAARATLRPSPRSRRSRVSSRSASGVGSTDAAQRPEPPPVTSFVESRRSRSWLSATRPRTAARTACTNSSCVVSVGSSSRVESRTGCHRLLRNSGAAGSRTSPPLPRAPPAGPEVVVELEGTRTLDFGCKPVFAPGSPALQMFQYKTEARSVKGKRRGRGESTRAGEWPRVTGRPQAGRLRRGPGPREASPLVTRSFWPGARCGRLRCEGRPAVRHRTKLSSCGDRVSNTEQDERVGGEWSAR